MSHIEIAKSLLLETQRFTCVLCKGDVLYTAKQRGIKPMLDYLDAEVDLHGFSAADRVVGKAAAFLFVLAGIKEVYAQTVSEAALSVFAYYGIPCIYDQRVPYIINRAGNGPCPMEHAVREIENPEEARRAISITLQSLSKQ